MSCAMPPPNITNGFIQGSNFVYGGEYKLVCNNGFQPRGSTVASCDGTGTWTQLSSCQGTVFYPSFWFYVYSLSTILKKTLKV